MCVIIRRMNELFISEDYVKTDCTYKHGLQELLEHQENVKKEYHFDTDKTALLNQRAALVGWTRPRPRPRPRP